MQQNKLERLDAFIAEREAHSDWLRFTSRDRTMLHRQLLCEHCGFPRSTLYQNPAIKKRLAALEDDLRRRKLLTAPFTEHLNENAASLTDSDMEQQIEVLEARLRLACEKLQESKAYLESFLPDNILEELR